MRALISSLIILHSFLSSAATYLTIQTEQAQRQDTLAIVKNGAQLICNSESIKEYPMVRGMPKNDPLEKMKSVKKFDAKSLHCDRKVFIERNVATQSTRYQACLEPGQLKLWLDELDRRCGR
jgi:hypothetical protein